MHFPALIILFLGVSMHFPACDQHNPAIPMRFPAVLFSALVGREASWKPASIIVTQVPAKAAASLSNADPKASTLFFNSIIIGMAAATRPTVACPLLLAGRSSL